VSDTVSVSVSGQFRGNHLGAQTPGNNSKRGTPSQPFATRIEFWSGLENEVEAHEGESYKRLMGI
jgi:hypothetical protein